MPPHLPGVPDWWPRRLGKRSIGMIGMAYIWLWLGLANFQDLPVERPGVPYLALDGDIRSAIWAVPALFALSSCVSRRLSWLGLGLLVIPPVVVVASYGWSLILFHLYGASQGYPGAYYQAALYGALPGMVLYVAYQPPPPFTTAVVAA